MKSLKFLLIATLGMLFFTSCTKESESLSQTIECETFSNSEIINLGKTHNEIAINAYSQIDIQSCGSCTDELTAVLTNICLDMGESESNCNEYLAMSKSLDEILRSLGYQVSNWNNHPFTEEVYSAMVAIENLLSTVNNHT